MYWKERVLYPLRVTTIRDTEGYKKGGHNGESWGSLLGDSIIVNRPGNWNHFIYDRFSVQLANTFAHKMDFAHIWMTDSFWPCVSPTINWNIIVFLIVNHSNWTLNGWLCFPTLTGHQISFRGENPTPLRRVPHNRYDWFSLQNGRIPYKFSSCSLGLSSLSLFLLILFWKTCSLRIGILTNRQWKPIRRLMFTGDSVSVCDLCWRFAFWPF